VVRQSASSLFPRGSLEFELVRELFPLIRIIIKELGNRNGSSEPEIGDFYVELRVYQNITGLEVPMENSGLVHQP